MRWGKVHRVSFHGLGREALKKTFVPLFIGQVIRVGAPISLLPRPLRDWKLRNVPRICGTRPGPFFPDSVQLLPNGISYKSAVRAHLYARGRLTGTHYVFFEIKR
jgi:hypothetical protein